MYATSAPAGTVASAFRSAENKMLPTVTCWFIRGIIRNGRLTKARKRFEAGTARPNGWNFESCSCWSVVCEEVIDTDHDPEGYDAVYVELVRRGFSADEIDEMRRLAWRTAGWLNYDMMVWDWCNLDESDMRRALDLKLKKRLTRKKTYDRDLQTIQRFLDRDPETAKKQRQGKPRHDNPCQPPWFDDFQQRRLNGWKLRSFGALMERWLQPACEGGGSAWLRSDSPAEASDPSLAG